MKIGGGPFGDPIKVCTKKWYIQGEVCGLTKKLVTVIAGHFSLTKSAE